MATAYAALTSLMHLIKDLRGHPRPPIKLDEDQVDSLNSIISFFQRFLERHHGTIDHGLAVRIADAAHGAEDLIEKHIGRRVHIRFYFRKELQTRIEAMELVKNEVMEKNWTKQTRQGRPSTPLLPSSPSPSNTDVVGIEGITLKIVDRLTSHRESRPQIISITGMGGIGKATLARNIYDHPYIKDYFDICAWATISKDYETQETLVEIRHGLGRREREEMSLSRENERDLNLKLYQKYFIGRRYLVILDDVWDRNAWETLRSSFPDSSGSGIVITTRETTVSSPISSLSFKVDFSDERKSWDLFRNKVFGKHSCPPRLESVGKNIANKCGGLPLSIAAIGGHLAKSPRTQEYWEYIADNLSSIVNSEDDERCLKILSLSFTHLPVHLKPCFMYMAIFPEDKEISIPQLTELWVAEGFLKPINRKSLEEAAEEYVHDLIGRNLILASDHESSSVTGRKVRSCRIHDLFRDLCLEEAKKENFLCIVPKKPHGVPKISNSERRVVVHQSSFAKVVNYLFGTVAHGPKKLVRTLIFDGILPSSATYKSMRVLCSFRRFLKMKQETWESAGHNLVNLRYLRFSVKDRENFVKIPPSIVSLWNLQSLALADVAEFEAPHEIWRMHQLRHITMLYLSLPDLPPPPRNDVLMMLKNLQSAETIRNFSFSEDSVEGIPNIKKLKVEYDVGGTYTLNNIARLEKLESLSCSFFKARATMRSGILSNIAFPLSLKTLEIDCLHWDDVTTKMGSLPLLEVLRLSHCVGREWNLVDEGRPDQLIFVGLKYLRLSNCDDLESFAADRDHFPCLRELTLYKMKCLKEISTEIGDVMSLSSIQLIECPDSAVASAEEIADEQCENEDLQIEVILVEGSKLSPMELTTISNFHVKAY